MRNLPLGNTGQRANIPSWLSNPNLVAPCPCGRPLIPGQPYAIGQTEAGLRRWFHGQCWMADEDDDLEDDDE